MKFRQKSAISTVLVVLACLRAGQANAIVDPNTSPVEGKRIACKNPNGGEFLHYTFNRRFSLFEPNDTVSEQIETDRNSAYDRLRKDVFISREKDAGRPKFFSKYAPVFQPSLRHGHILHAYAREREREEYQERFPWVWVNAEQERIFSLPVPSSQIECGLIEGIDEPVSQAPPELLAGDVIDCALPRPLNGSKNVVIPVAEEYLGIGYPNPAYVYNPNISFSFPMRVSTANWVYLGFAYSRHEEKLLKVSEVEVVAPNENGKLINSAKYSFSQLVNGVDISTTAGMVKCNLRERKQRQ